MYRISVCTLLVSVLIVNIVGATQNPQERIKLGSFKFGEKGLNVNNKKGASYGMGEQIITQVLERIRDSMTTGLDEWGIPVLEPWKIDLLEFDLNHEIGKLQGHLSNATINGLSTFVIDYLEYPFEEGYMYLNLNISYLYGTGDYDITGMVSDLFAIYGKGPFALNMTDFHLESYAEIITVGPLMEVTYLDANVSISGLPAYFYNFMGGDEDLEPLFNKLIPQFAPEAMYILWPEISTFVNPLIMDMLNQLFYNIFSPQRAEQRDFQKLTIVEGTDK